MIILSALFFNPGEAGAFRALDLSQLKSFFDYIPAFI